MMKLRLQEMVDPIEIGAGIKVSIPPKTEHCRKNARCTHTLLHPAKAPVIGI